MHTENLSNWMHGHVFDTGNDAAERSTRVVMWITAVMMVVEIAAGWWFNSMALLADGWHMSSHAVAIGLSAMAYATARRYAKDPRFAFGTWKIEILGGFASAIFLLGGAVMMVVGSVERIVSPQPIQYQEAIVIAVLGLAVNVICALILGKAHHHDHGHSHGHDHGHVHHHGDHHDLNLKSAYLHVIADAATSVLAIVALVGGWIYGWSWLGPVAWWLPSGPRVSSPIRARCCSTARWITPWSMRFGRWWKPGRTPVTRESPTCTSGAWASRSIRAP